MKQKGFTLIELLIVAAIMGIIGVLVFNGLMGVTSGSHLSVGWNGVTEFRCINGLQFTVSNDGSTRQVFDTLGHGVACQ